MGRKCCVPNCTSGYDKCKDKISLFAIPKNSQAIPRKDRNLTESDHVCEKHFTPECIIRELKTECYMIPLKIPKLKKESVPTIFPNCSQYISKTVPQKRRDILKHEGVHVKRIKLGIICGNTEVEAVGNPNASMANADDTYHKPSLDAKALLPKALMKRTMASTKVTSGIKLKTESSEINCEPTTIRTRSSVRENKPSLVKTEEVKIGIHDIWNPSYQEDIDKNIKQKILHNGSSLIKTELPLIKTEPVEIGIADIYNSSDEENIDTGFKRNQKEFNSRKENVPINTINKINEDSNNNPNEFKDENTNHEDINVVNNLTSNEKLVVNFTNSEGIQNNRNKSISRDQINWAEAYKTDESTDCKEDMKKVILRRPPKMMHRIASHELTSLTRNKHVCNHCQLSSKDKRQVKTHIRKQHRETTATYLCPYCPYKSRHTLRYHIIAKHKDIKDIRWFECYECNKKFKLKQLMARHIRKVHSTVYNWRFCPICKKQYQNSDAVNHHIKHVHKLIPKSTIHCEECEFSCQDRTALKHHVEVNHTFSHQLPTHKCKRCDYQTKYEFLMWKHNKFHEAQVSCDECGFLAAKGDKLKLHQMTHKKKIDESELKYRCTECDYKTYRPYSFQVHKLNHLKPHEIQYFYCYHCDFKAKRKDNLKTHVLRHFKKDDVTFHCFICDFSTKKRNLLISHIKKHSKA